MEENPVTETITRKEYDDLVQKLASIETSVEAEVNKASEIDKKDEIIKLQQEANASLDTKLDEVTKSLADIPTAVPTADIQKMIDDGIKAGLEAVEKRVADIEAMPVYKGAKDGDGVIITEQPSVLTDVIKSAYGGT